MLRFSQLVAATCVMYGVALCFVQANGFQTIGAKNPTTTRHGWLNPIHQKVSFLRGASNDKSMGDEVGKLTSALARIDKQWQLQQRKRGAQGRWTKVNLNSGGGGDDDDVVYMLEPESTLPISRVICFLGGAGLGQFPHVAYSTFLERISTRLNAMVLAVPYQAGLDHFTLAKQTGERVGEAIIQCVEEKQDVNGENRKFRPDYKTHCIAHSLGAKLSTIHMAATGQEYDGGVGFLSYNNFGFAQTISMIRSFVQQLRDGGLFSEGDSTASNDKKPDSDGEEFLNTIFDLAETVVGAIGVEFSPSPTDTDRLVELKYNAKDNTRLFQFDEDNLDNSQAFYEACNRHNDEDTNDGGPSVSGLPGTHLTPVYFQFSFDELPEEASEFASEAAGIRSASFGNEENLNLLVDEVYDWIMGDDPSRQPSWLEEEIWQGPRRITGGVSNTD